jgi:hypothetical protein
MGKCVVLEYNLTNNGSQLINCVIYSEGEDPYTCYAGDIDFEAIKAQQDRINALELKYHDLVVAANTLLYCYDKNPRNFNMSRRELERELNR